MMIFFILPIVLKILFLYRKVRSYAFSGNTDLSVMEALQREYEKLLNAQRFDPGNWTTRCWNAISPN